MIRTILIDDEALARDIVKHYLKAFPDVEIVAECSDGFEGLKAITQHQPDLIFLDIQMPKMSGFELINQIQFTQSIDSISLAIGRIPARTIVEADKVVEKLIQYQSNKKMGLWRDLFPIEPAIFRQKKKQALE